MPIDPNSETLVSLSQAGKHLPRRRAGKRPHISCLYRWSTAGCRGVVLETIQIGGTRCTSREALHRFFDALTAAADNRAPAIGAPVFSGSRLRQIEAAEARLATAQV